MGKNIQEALEIHFMTRAFSIEFRRIKMQQTQEFQAEVKELLNLMVHSIYSNKEIFLRELISNATDAIDKRKFEALTKPEFKQENGYAHIELKVNPENHSMQIIDSGIGMSREELVENIGTIAKSGTKQFSQLAKEMKDNPELIGQFGVGFYSSFMVAERVTLHTRRADQTEGWFWDSKGDGTYSIMPLDKDSAGTTITLYFKSKEENEDKDYTEEWVLRDLVKRYSDFIPYPIEMEVEREEVDRDEEGKEIESTRKKVVKKEVLNSMKALWTKTPSEVTEEEYKDFYKQMTFDWTDPYKHIHYKAEGMMEFSSLMYIPAKKPFNFNTVDQKFGLDLYVKKVFIMSQCEELLPAYLRFVPGVVDSSDLSLNISREMLQQDRQLTQIRKAIVGKILNELKDSLKNDRENYDKFFTEFGPVIKEGIASDSKNREKIAETLLFKWTGSEQRITLAEYLEKKPEHQKEIYFLTGENAEHLKNSPHLEALKEKSFEALLLDDDIDEWVVSHLHSFKDVALKSATKSNLDLDTEEEKKAKEEESKKLAEEYSDIIDSFKNGLGEKVKEVRVSSRLTDSPVVLVDEENDMSANMKRILAQHRGEKFDDPRILEINPKHAVFAKMKEASSDDQKEWAELFYGQALLNEGSQLPDPVKFSQQINKLLI